VKYRIVGFGDTRTEDDDRSRGSSVALNLAEVPEMIAYALWVDKCRYVTVELE